MSKNIEKMQLLENKMEPLIDQIVFIDGSLVKIKNYSLLKLYGEEYKCDKVSVLNTDIPYIRRGPSKTYKHFTNEVVSHKFKMLNSQFYGYTVVDDIDNVYFIDNKQYKNYNTSHFKNDKIQLVQDIEEFISSMINGPMNEINNITYYNCRKAYLSKIFNKYSFRKYKDEIKQLINKDNFIRYLKLYVEHKQNFLNELHADSILLLKEKTEKLIKELKEEIAILRNEDDSESDESDDDDDL
jgi:hypothetical protein